MKILAKADIKHVIYAATKAEAMEIIRGSCWIHNINWWNMILLFRQIFQNAHLSYQWRLEESRPYIT